MKVSITTKTRIPELVKESKKLNGKTISVGVFGGDIAQIAMVHEFGATIVPKNKKWLCIPLKKKYKGKNPRELNLIFIKTSENRAWLCKKAGKNKLEFCYMLAKKVVIPERSFLRAGWDENEKAFFKFAEKQLEKWILKGGNPDVMLDALGLQLRGYIQTYIRDLSSPPNSGITKAVKGSSNPLVDTGNLIQSIEYEVK